MEKSLLLLYVVAIVDDDGGVGGACDFGDGGGAPWVGAAASVAVWPLVESILEKKKKQCSMSW